MSKDDLRVETTEYDQQLIASMGIDPMEWATQIQKVMPNGINCSTAAAWFHHAMEAARKAEASVSRALGEPATARSPVVWGASGFELRCVAASARASLSRLREYVGFEHEAPGASAAFDLVDWHLGSITNDPAFGDAGDR